MCGIAGVAFSDPAGCLDRRRLETAVHTLTHRGPDGVGYHEAPGVAMGMRRLAVQDVEGGVQPVFSEDRRVVTVFNGEIYNFRELRNELEQRSHRFQSRTDTEVVVHLYEERGSDFVHELNGMFACAVWDSANRRLVLVRDRVGIKPLYYACLPDR